MKKVLALMLVLVGVVWVIPAYFTLQTSFLDAFTSPLNLISHGHFRNWQALPWHIMDKWILNSAIVCTSSSILSVLICIGAGYGFVRYDFPGKEKLFYLILLAMSIPGIVFFLPRYLLVARFNLIGSYAGLILPMILIPGSVFFARQYLAEIDISIIEAARLDGASEFRIFWGIILPLSMPLIVICFLSAFGTSYANFMWQYLVGRDILTLTTGIGLFLLGTDTMGLLRTTTPATLSVESIRAAASILQASPLIVLFAIGQKWVLKGTKI